DKDKRKNQNKSKNKNKSKDKDKGKVKSNGNSNNNSDNDETLCEDTEMMNLLYPKRNYSPNNDQLMVLLGGQAACSSNKDDGHDSHDTEKNVSMLCALSVQTRRRKIKSNFVDVETQSHQNAKKMEPEKEEKGLFATAKALLKHSAFQKLKAQQPKQNTSTNQKQSV
ncbi:hypothetical protein RFI_06553, partial [Reticulomyxa filosa]